MDQIVHWMFTAGEAEKKFDRLVECSERVEGATGPTLSAKEHFSSGIKALACVNVVVTKVSKFSGTTSASPQGCSVVRFFLLYD